MSSVYDLNPKLNQMTPEQRKEEIARINEIRRTWPRPELLPDQRVSEALGRPTLAWSTFSDSPFSFSKDSYHGDMIRDDF